MKDKVNEPYFSFKPLNARAFILISVFICFGSGIILSTLVEQNTNYFWEFAKKVTPVDIEKIEIQRLDENGRNLGEIITVSNESNESNISAFVTALKTIEEYQPNQPRPIHKVRLKIWQYTRNIFNFQRTVEFECYTMRDEGETLFVGSVWINPEIYSYGNGNAKFTMPNLMNWLEKNGISMSD